MVPPPAVTTLKVPPVGAPTNVVVELGHVTAGALNVTTGNALTTIETTVSSLQPELVTLYFNDTVPGAVAVKVVPEIEAPPDTTVNVPPAGVPVKALVEFTHIAVTALVILATGLAVGVIVPSIVVGQLVPDTPGWVYLTTIAVEPEAVNAPVAPTIEPGPLTTDQLPLAGVLVAVVTPPALHTVVGEKVTADKVTKGLTVIVCVVVLVQFVVASVKL